MFCDLHFFFPNHPTRCSQQQQKNRTDFPAKIKQENKQKYHRHQPKKTRSSSFFRKKKKVKYHWEYKTKEAIVTPCFPCFPLGFVRFFWGKELLSFVVLRTLHALPPKSGSPTWGNHEQQGEGGEHKSQFFFYGLLRFHLPKKKMGAKWIRFWWVFLVVTDFLSLDFGLWMFFLVLGWLKGPRWWVVFYS